jgi:triacylglycerol lipase
MKATRVFFLAVLWIGVGSVSRVHAQVPADIEASLRKIGQVVDPACTSKLYRPLMPKNDYNTYWPVGASAPNKTGAAFVSWRRLSARRPIRFQAKDLVDIFSPESGGGNRTVLIYLPGGARKQD